MWYFLAKATIMWEFHIFIPNRNFVLSIYQHQLTFVSDPCFQMGECWVNENVVEVIGWWQQSWMMISWVIHRLKFMLIPRILTTIELLFHISENLAYWKQFEFKLIRFFFFYSGPYMSLTSPQTVIRSSRDLTTTPADCGTSQTQPSSAPTRNTQTTFAVVLPANSTEISSLLVSQKVILQRSGKMSKGQEEVNLLSDKQQFAMPSR